MNVGNFPTRHFGSRGVQTPLVVNSQIAQHFVRVHGYRLPDDNHKISADILDYLKRRDKYHNYIGLKDSRVGVEYAEDPRIIIKREKDHVEAAEVNNLVMEAFDNDDLCVFCQTSVENGKFTIVQPCVDYVPGNCCAGMAHAHCLVAWRIVTMNPNAAQPFNYNCPTCNKQCFKDRILKVARAFWKTAPGANMKRVNALHNDATKSHIPKRSEYCKYFTETGFCPYGKTCLYKHGPRVMEQPADPPHNETPLFEIEQPDEPDNTFRGYGSNDHPIPEDELPVQYVVKSKDYEQLDLVVPYQDKKVVAGFATEVKLLMGAFMRDFSNVGDKVMFGKSPTHYRITEIEHFTLPNNTRDVRDFMSRTHAIEADGCEKAITFEVKLYWDKNISNTWFQRTGTWLLGEDLTASLEDLEVVSQTLLVTKIISGAMVESVLPRVINSSINALPTLLARVNRSATLNLRAHSTVYRDTVEYMCLQYMAHNQVQGLNTTLDQIVGYVPSLVA